MTLDREALLQRLINVPEDDVVGRVRALLMREHTRLISDEVYKVSVSEALRLWKTRLKNTEVTGLHIHGLRLFVQRLSNLSPQRRLEQFAFVGADGSGNLFFEAASPYSLVGAVLVDSWERSEAAARKEMNGDPLASVDLPVDQRQVTSTS